MIDTKRKINFPRKIAFLCIAVGALLLPVSCASNGAWATSCEGTVTNDTGEPLVSIRLAVAGTDLRMAEFLGTPLASGETRAFSAEKLFVRYWDVHAIGASGREYALWSVFLVRESTLMFTRDDRVEGDDSE
jgi:hypothetical protein